MNNLDLLKAATQLAEEFGSDPVVATTPAPYDENQDNPTISRWFDPLLYWSLRNCQRWPLVLILLHNWGNEASSLGTVMSNVAYTEKCWQNVKGDNPSFRNMFDVTSWSRQLIASGECLVANTAWGPVEKQQDERHVREPAGLLQRGQAPVASARGPHPARSALPLRSLGSRWQVRDRRRHHSDLGSDRPH
jgi:hypothetical protein